VLTHAVRRRAATLLLVGFAAGGCSSSSSSSERTVASTTTTVAATTTTTVPPVATLTKKSAVSPIYGQGVARVAGGWIFSGTRWLAHTDEAFHQTSINEHALTAEWLAKGYNHVGDIDVIGNVLYAPYEQPNYELGHQATAVYDATTLQFVSAVEVKQHENSFVTVDPTTMIAYSMDRFGGQALLRYDVKHAWAPLAPLKMSRLVDRVQGADIAEGAAWLSTDDKTKGLYRVDLSTGHVDALGSLGYLKGEGEGIDATPMPSGLLHALIVPPELVPIYLEEYRVGPRTS
jgi:hypothetical protein